MSTSENKPATDRLRQFWQTPSWRFRMRLSIWRRMRGVKADVQCLQEGVSLAGAPGDTDFTVVAMFRNGAYYLDSFIQHYQKLGARKIVLLDNGSTDESREVIRRYPEVCLLRSTLPYLQHIEAFRHYLMKTYATAGWALVVDIDELLDFPGSGSVSLRQFLEYLNQSGYTAVQGYMLDRFGEAALGKAGSCVGDDLSSKYPYYDLENVTKDAYTAKDLGPRGGQGCSEIMACYGGVRKRLMNADVTMSKFPLIRKRRGQLTGTHHIHNALRADVSVVLNHYRFLDDIENVIKNFHGMNINRYSVLMNKLEAEGDVYVYRDGVQTWRNADALVAEGFLIAGSGYREWLKDLGLTLNEGPSAQ